MLFSVFITLLSQIKQCQLKSVWKCNFLSNFLYCVVCSQNAKSFGSNPCWKKESYSCGQIHAKSQEKHFNNIKHTHFQFSILMSYRPCFLLLVFPRACRKFLMRDFAPCSNLNERILWNRIFSPWSFPSVNENLSRKCTK